jgi:membrane protein
MKRTKLELFINNLPFVRFVRIKARRVVLPGLRGASLYEVNRFFFGELNSVRLFERAAAVTYNFLMAMPPTFLFLFSLIPYLPLKHVEPTILSTLKLITPNDHIYDAVSSIVLDFMNTQRREVLSFGVILVIFFSSNGIMGLMRSFDGNQVLYKKRSGLARRWTAVKLTLMIIFIGLISLTILIMQSENLNGWLLRIFHSLLAIKLLSVVILTLLVFVAISVIFRFGPHLTHTFSFVSAGSVFATLLCMTVTSVFFYLVNNFINYNKFYGTIGTLIAFMVWVWLNTLSILLGFELNVGILLGKLSHTEDAEEKEEIEKATQRI